VLSGQRWIAFDLTARTHPGSWWVSLVSGVTDMPATMTVLQAGAWVAYLTLVIPAYMRAGRTAAAPGGANERRTLTTQEAGRWERLAGRRPWAVAGVLVVMPLLAAFATVAALPDASSVRPGTCCGVTAVPAAAPLPRYPKPSGAPSRPSARPGCSPGRPTPG
jgi:high-affinity iron transporter